MSSKKNKTQKKINKKKVFIALTICILVALIGGVSVLAYGVYKDTETFDAKKLLSSGASVMYDDQGQVLYTYGSEENGTRENITYEDLPQVLVDAVVAAAAVAVNNPHLSSHSHTTSHINRTQMIS